MLVLVDLVLEITLLANTLSERGVAMRTKALVRGGVAQFVVGFRRTGTSALFALLLATDFFWGGDVMSPTLVVSVHPFLVNEVDRVQVSPASGTAILRLHFSLR